MQQQKVALVTGASRGIGAACARRLAAEGYAVAVNYHGSKALADEVVKSIAQAGGKAVAIQADMGKEADIVRLFETTDRELGKLSVLVNNAAVTAHGPVTEITEQTLSRLLAVNVTGVFLACREALTRMKNGGVIINLTSEAAKFGGNKMSAYAASKAAVSTFTLAFAREAAAQGVRVSALSPGVIDTDTHAGVPPERIAALKASIPMGRMGTAEEVAEAVVWLVSDKAGYVSGAILPITGAR